MSNARWRIIAIDDERLSDRIYKVQHRDGVGHDDRWYDCEERVFESRTGIHRPCSTWLSLNDAKAALRRIRVEAEGPSITVVHEEP